MTRPTVPEACIAVFDVGKTNKKLLIYDRNFSLLDSTYAQFEEFQTSCELHERIQETGQWLIEALAHMNARYPIGAVSVSAHGGAFVCLDGEGEIAMPVLSYNSDPGEDFHSRFAREYGDPEQLQRVTCSPSMPGLGNMAKGIAYAMQAYPGEFGRTRSILPLPQYYGFLLTGRKAIEHTCLCNHTCLWDFRAQDWSFVAKRLGILDRFPRRLSRPWDVLGRITPALASATGLRTDTIVTVGVHDSNAALLPYLVSRSGSFMLLSTGSVCVAMHPTTEVFLRPDELGKVIFYNGSVFGDPVKTTIFLAGLEFDVYMEMLAGLKGSAEHPAFDRDLCADILKGQGEFILPALVPFGMFPESTARIIEPGRSRSFMEVAGGSIPEFFNDFERAYTVLTLSLAIHTQVALERGLPDQPGGGLGLRGRALGRERPGRDPSP